MTFGDRRTDLLLLEQGRRVKSVNSPSYPAAIFDKKETSDTNFGKRIGQGNQTVRRLHSVLWNNGIREYNKINIHKTVVENMLMYGAELRNKQNGDFKL